jgi:hypothetical protein
MRPTFRLLLERLDHDALDIRVRDRARNSNARLVIQTRESALDETLPRKANCLYRRAQAPGDLRVRLAGVTGEHKARSKRDRDPDHAGNRETSRSSVSL